MQFHSLLVIHKLLAYETVMKRNKTCIKHHRVWGCITLPLKMLSILSNSVTKLYLSIHAKHHAIWSLTCACKKYPNRVTIISWLHHKNNFSNMGQIWVWFPKCLWPVIPLPWNCPYLNIILQKYLPYLLYAGCLIPVSRMSYVFWSK